MIFRGLLFLAELLFWLLVLRLLLRALAHAFVPARPAAGRPAPRAQVKAAEDLVLDRVCHTYVPLKTALSARVAGREEHFCSVACREKALAAVARAS
jgi:YHS domain-containing protein